MHRLVTCDEVFDVLTRGPFPTGASDDMEIELHLSGCHECRQLAEALRPASGLLRESLAESLAETRLPTYRGRVGAEPWLEASEPPAPRGQGLWLAQAARLAAALLLIAGLCTAAGMVGQLRAREPLTTEQLRARLATSPVTSICLTSLESPAAREACCTSCHHVSAKQAIERRSATVRLLASSCRTCHE